MQTVWSRVAQARNICNCPSCLLTTNTIARRATTATARRTVRVGDVFTVSLSSLAAGLAFVDSKKKDDRRKQWDKVIAEARATVEATELQHESRLAALSEGAKAKAWEENGTNQHDVSTGRMVEDVEAWDIQDSGKKDEQMPVSIDTSDTWLDVFDWARQHNKIREASGFQNWKGPPLSLLQSLSKAQLNELLSDEWLLRRFYGGPNCHSLVDEQSKFPFSMKKLRTLEWSVAKLVLRLLSYYSKESSKRGEGTSCPAKALLRQLLNETTMEKRLEYINRRLRTLHTKERDFTYYKDFETPEIPNYENASVTDFEKRLEMNLSLQKLLKLMKSETDLSDLVSKICYNLLAAWTPPNTDTYNELLIRFCILGKGDLFRAVLTSMRESHIRPNEITHATVLRNFTTTGNRREFFHHWMRMEGYRTGHSVLKPGSPIHPLAKERYLIFGTNSGDKAAEKARMNGQVYEWLIRGAIQFFSGQTAMHFYRNMISEGWSPSLGIFHAILQDCCQKLDWAVGSAVIEQLGMTADKINTLTFEWMLRLCQCCGQQESFDHILLKGVQCGALPASMLDLPEYAKAKDVGFLIKHANNLGQDKATSQKAPIKGRLFRDSPFLLENILLDCEDGETKCHIIRCIHDRLKVRYALQARLDAISREIKHTSKQAKLALNTYPLDHMSSVKFWLSEQVKRLKEELNNDLVPHEKVQRARRVAVSEKDEPGKPNYVPITAGPSKDVSKVVNGEERQQLVQWVPAAIPPENPVWQVSEKTEHGEPIAVSHSKDVSNLIHGEEQQQQQQQLVQSESPSLLLREIPPEDSFWKDSEEQLAAIAWPPLRVWRPYKVGDPLEPLEDPSSGTAAVDKWFQLKSLNSAAFGEAQASSHVLERVV